MLKILHARGFADRADRRRFRSLSRSRPHEEGNGVTPALGATTALRPASNAETLRNPRVESSGFCLTLARASK